MTSEHQSIPLPALALGLGGLIPFFAAVLLVWWPSFSEQALFALVVRQSLNLG